MSAAPALLRPPPDGAGPREPRLERRPIPPLAAILHEPHVCGLQLSPVMARDDFAKYSYI